MQDFLGITRPQTPPRQTRGAAALGWIDPATQPFTPAWYAQHPKAWHAAHPHADVAVVATATGLAAWLAVPYVPATTTTSVVETTTVVTEGAVSSEESSAGDLASSGAGEVADDTQYMSIGVLALKPLGQTEATRVIHLAVSREGIIRGSHYDLISDEVQNIQGAVDKDNLQVAWTIGEQGRAVFQAPLGELSQPEGKVTVRFPGGKTAPWQTVQLTP